MSLDLSAARAAITGKVNGLSAIAATYSNFIPEGETPPKDAYGILSPYAITHFGRPVPDHGRTLADGEGDYPHVWPFYVELIAPTGYDIDAIADSLDSELIDFQPDGDNSTAIRGAGSYSYPLPSSDNMPARIGLNRYYLCTVNMERPQ